MISLLIGYLSFSFSYSFCAGLPTEEEILQQWFNAAETGDWRKIQELLEQVDINSQNKDGLTALMLAAFRAHPAIVGLLSRTPNIDINARDNNGNTALILAAQMGRSDIVKILLDEGANPIASNKDGKRALDFSREREKKGVASESSIYIGEAIKKLIDKLFDAAQMSPEFAKDASKIIVKIYNLGFDMNQKDKRGNTPLMHVVARNNQELAKVLLGLGADLNVKNNYNETPADVAEKAGHHDLAVWLNKKAKERASLD